MLNRVNVIMNEVKVNRIKLLNTVQENYKKHREILQEAKAGYVKKAQEVFQEKLNKANNGIVDLRLDLKAPEDYSKQYEVAIEMLKWEVSEEIKLSHNDFKSFVMDDWSWKENFLFSNVEYSATASGLYFGN